MRGKKSDEKTSTKHSSAVAVVEALFTFDTEVGDCAACTSCAEPKSFFSGKHFVCSHGCCRSATKSILFYYYFIVLLWHNYFYCKSETAVTVCVCARVSLVQPTRLPKDFFGDHSKIKACTTRPFATINTTNKIGCWLGCKLQHLAFYALNNIASQKGKAESLLFLHCETLRLSQHEVDTHTQNDWQGESAHFSRIGAFPKRTAQR